MPRAVRWSAVRSLEPRTADTRGACSRFTFSTARRAQLHASCTHGRAQGFESARAACGVASAGGPARPAAAPAGPAPRTARNGRNGQPRQAAGLVDVTLYDQYDDLD